jgi:hypothetical protein
VKRGFLLGLLLLAVAAGCSSSSKTNTLTIGPARQYAIVDRLPKGTIEPGRPVTMGFTIRQPNGQPLTDYKTGAGPHTGLHLIIVKKDLSVIIHRHPPVGPNGEFRQAVVFPSPGPYHVLVDVYPRKLATTPSLQLSATPNFQLSYNIRVAGKYRPKPLPVFKPSLTVEGYHVVLHGKPRLRAIQAQTLLATVTDPQGKPLGLKPWYGALAHAVFFHVSNLDYFHTHVCGPNTPGCTSILGTTKVTGRSTKPGVMRVGVLLPESGTWELFLQFMGNNGKILTAPFTLKVS